MTISLARNGTTFTWGAGSTDPVPLITEALNKEIHKHKGGLDEGIAIVMDHLRNVHLFILNVTWITDPGVKTAWQKRREFIEAMQYIGKIWDLNFLHSEEGIDETYEVVCEKINLADIGAKVKEVKGTITLMQSKDIEAL